VLRILYATASELPQLSVKKYSSRKEPEEVDDQASSAVGNVEILSDQPNLLPVTYPLDTAAI
jgi:hypothetical protein